MTNDRPYLYNIPSRHGQDRWYFWRGKGHPRIRFKVDYGTPEFDKRYGDLRTEAVNNSTPVEPLPLLPTSKPKTFRWLCEKFWKSRAFTAKASERTQYQSKRILELCCQEPIRLNHPKGETFADYPLTGIRAMRLSDLEILRDRASKKQGKLGGLGAADMRVRHLKRLFRWAMKHREKTHIEHDIAAHLDYISEDTGGWHTWAIEELESYEKRHPIGTQARMAFDIFQYTGCAISDVIKLGEGSVFEDDGVKVCRFNRTKKRSGQKEGVDANVGMCRALLDSIAACNHKGTETWLITERGKPFASPEAFRNKFKDWCRQAKLPEECTSHGIRKAVACRLAYKGTPHQTAMAILGWLTFKEYDHYARQANRQKMGRAGVTLLWCLRTWRSCNTPRAPPASPRG